MHIINQWKLQDINNFENSQHVYNDWSFKADLKVLSFVIVTCLQLQENQLHSRQISKCAQKITTTFDFFVRLFCLSSESVFSMHVFVLMPINGAITHSQSVGYIGFGFVENVFYLPRIIATFALFCIISPLTFDLLPNVSLRSTKKLHTSLICCINIMQKVCVSSLSNIF